MSERGPERGRRSGCARDGWHGHADAGHATRVAAQARCRSTSGRRLAKSSLLGHAARAASRSAPDQSRASGSSAAYWRRASARIAVVLVVGEEPGQVAQLGLGAGGHRAAAVAVGAEGRVRGQGGVAELHGSRPSSAARSGGRRRRSRGAGRSSCIETHEPLIRSSVQIACRRPWYGREALLLEPRRPPDDLLEDVELRLGRELAGDLLHRDQADALLVAGVEGLVQRLVLVEPGGVHGA